MKKLLTILLTLLMVFTLVGCNSKQDTPVVEEPQQEEVVEPVKEEEPEIVGGYVDVEDGTLTDELKDIFTKALEGLTGASYEPQELVATQVVSGTNYKFLANGTKTTNPLTKGSYYITIYKDLEGNVELLDIETIEEKQEEKKTVDLTQYSYWVVVYDQFGNEISRTTAKYGTTVKDPNGNDVLVDGNKYFNAVINYSSPEKDDEPAPTPTPACNNTNTLIYLRAIANVGDFEFNNGTPITDDAKREYLAEIFSFNNGKFVCGSSVGTDVSVLGENNLGKFIHLDESSGTFVECTSPDSHVFSNEVQSVVATPQNVDFTNSSVRVFVCSHKASNLGFTIDVDPGVTYQINGDTVTFSCGGSPITTKAYISSIADPSKRAEIDINFGA